MEFKKDVLQKVAIDGSEAVAKALTRLAGSKATVEVSRVQNLPFRRALDFMRPEEEKAIVVYSQIISGAPIPGVSTLTLSRADALNLVDLLSRNPIGTTGILKDIDRSAIKETLNILSNSYTNTLANASKIELGLGVPNMVTPMRMRSIIEAIIKSGKTEGGTALIFETVITIRTHKVRATLFLVFNETLQQHIIEVMV